MTDIPHTEEHAGSAAHGLYIALLMEATAVALAYVGFRLGGLLMIWAGALS